jgi:hypothetical protein
MHSPSPSFPSFIPTSPQISLYDESNSRFHGLSQNPYVYPSDELEAIRLDALQYVVKGLYRKNILVPVSKKANKILDLGAGSGILHSPYMILNWSFGDWDYFLSDFSASFRFGLSSSSCSSRFLL